MTNVANESTTEPTTTTTPPAWLDLDKLCPPELRARVVALVDEAGPMLDVVNSWAHRAQRVDWEIEAVIATAVQEAAGSPDEAHDIEDGLSTFLRHALGSADLLSLATLAGGLFNMVGQLAPAEQTDQEAAQR